MRSRGYFTDITVVVLLLTSDLFCALRRQTRGAGATDDLDADAGEAYAGRAARGRYAREVCAPFERCVLVEKRCALARHACAGRFLCCILWSLRNVTPRGHEG